MNLTKNSEFWNSRASKHGHTGWADPFIYAYDQPARVLAVMDLVRQLDLNASTVLDFGTGSGDFAAALADAFDTVIACDISDEAINRARRAHGRKRNITFHATGQVDDLEIADGSLAMAISITVLGHILEDQELIRVLSQLRQKLAVGGRFLALEFTPSQDMPATEYQCFRQPNVWLRLFEASGYVFEKHFGFQHPSEAPAPSYLAYRNKPLVKLLTRHRKRFIQHAWAKGICRRAAESALRNARDCYWPGRDNDVMRIMVFRSA